MLPRLARVTALVGVALSSSVAGAQFPTAPALIEITEDRGWPAGTVREQLDHDATMIPYGKGAIFVPAMTNPLDEPPVSVWQGETKIAEGTTGRRIVVLPGKYTVEMGTGAVEQRFSVSATVRELNVSVVPVTWAGMQVHMVDDRLNSIRGSYELIRVDTREYVDVGFGADEQAGEPLTTWIVEPGLYKIVRVGETYRARRDFATVRLGAGRFTDFLLVVDEETDEFKGAGEIPREELFLGGEGDFFWSLIFGGDVNVSSKQNAVRESSGESFSFRAFLDARVRIPIFGHPLNLTLQIEEGGSIAANLFDAADATEIPWQKLQDLADLDGLYVYRLLPWLGPYARFGIETNLFESLDYFFDAAGVPIDGRVDVLEENPEDGSVGYARSRKDRDHVLRNPSFGLTTIQEGIGVNLRVFKTLFGETSLRAGLGGRHTITNRLIQPRLELTNPRETSAEDLRAFREGLGPNYPACDGACLFYQRVPTTQQIGIEFTLQATLRFTRFVLMTIEFDSLTPFDDIENIVLDVEATLSLKLASFVSINYVFRYLRDPALAVGDQVPNTLGHDLQLRFSLQLP